MTIGSCSEVGCNCSLLQTSVSTADSEGRDCAVLEPLFSGVVASFSVSSSFCLFVPGLDDFGLLFGLL